MKEQEMPVVEAKQPIRRMQIVFTLRGTTPFLCNKPRKTGMDMLKAKQAGLISGAEKGNRKPKDLKLEYEESMWRTVSGKVGFPVSGLASSLLFVTRSDESFKKGLIAGGISSLEGVEGDGLLTIEGKPEYFETPAWVGPWNKRVMDFRARAMIRKWETKVKVTYDESLWDLQELIRLFDRCGFSVGIGSWAGWASKPGSYGRFEIKKE